MTCLPAAAAASVIGTMQVVGRAQIDDVDVGSLERAFKVGVDIGDAVALRVGLAALARAADRRDQARVVPGDTRVRARPRLGDEARCPRWQC